MKKALIGKKIGMTQYIAEDGTMIPVTVCELGPCVVIQKKTKEKDGYDALKLGFQNTKDTRLTKPILEDLKKKTGFDDKKLRNIVFRLHKLGKIKRVGRGKYTAA